MHNILKLYTKLEETDQEIDGMVRQHRFHLLAEVRTSTLSIRPYDHMYAS